MLIVTIFRKIKAIKDELDHLNFEEKFANLKRFSCQKGQIRIRSGTIIPDPDPTWPKRSEPDRIRIHTLLKIMQVTTQN
jgi:hypothetical protein